MLNIILQHVEDINILEKAVMKLACKIMELALMLLEKKLFENKPDYLGVIRFAERTIYTKIGEVTYKRCYYIDKRTGEKFHLLDKELGIREGKRANGDYLKLLVTLADKLSFRQVEEVIETADFPVLSYQKIHQEVRDFGERESKKIKQETEEIFSEGKEVKDKEQKNIDILFLEADGIMVSSQEKNERRMEVKVGLMHEGWEYCNPDKKRKRLINPRVVCGVYDNAEAFWEEFSARIAKHYDLTDTLVILNGDGARWIQDRSKDYFPHLNSTIR